MIRTLFISLALFLPAFSQAATLYLSPSSGSYTAGKAFTVSAFVSSPNQSMNAVSATISVDSSKFTIVSASSVGSIVNFWVQQPAVSGSTISLEGVVLNPGYQGNGAKIASFVLMPKSTGSGSVTFATASVLANDGQGTQILDSTSGGSFTIQEAQAQAPAVPAPKPAPEIEVAPPAPVPGEAQPPQITAYDEEVSYGDLAALRGVTYENAMLELFIYENGTLIATERAESNSSGDFSIIVTKRLETGAYELRVRVTTGEGLTSPEAGPYPLRVVGDIFSVLEWFTIGHLALIALMILAAIGVLSVLHAASFRRLFLLASDLQASQKDTSDVTKRVFAILKKDLSAHVKKMRDAGETRELSKEELAFLDEFAEELDEAETALTAKGKRKRTK